MTSHTLRNEAARPRERARTLARSIFHEFQNCFRDESAPLFEPALPSTQRVRSPKGFSSEIPELPTSRAGLPSVSDSGPFVLRVLNITSNRSSPLLNSTVNDPLNLSRGPFELNLSRGPFESLKSSTRPL